jgi:hypothetical protein
MSKTFTFAGTCVENNAVVYKFANDSNRAKALERFGCTEINMIQLPEAMDKDAAVAYLATVGMTAIKPARGAKPKSAATKPAKAKLPKAAKATKSKRVPSEMPKNADPVEFARLWFADKEAKVAAKRAEGQLP